MSASLAVLLLADLVVGSEVFWQDRTANGVTRGSCHEGELSPSRDTCRFLRTTLPLAAFEPWFRRGFGAELEQLDRQAMELHERIAQVDLRLLEIVTGGTPETDLAPLSAAVTAAERALATAYVEREQLAEQVRSLAQELNETSDADVAQQLTMTRARLEAAQAEVDACRTALDDARACLTDAQVVNGTTEFEALQRTRERTLSQLDAVRAAIDGELDELRELRETMSILDVRGPALDLPTGESLAAAFERARTTDYEEGRLNGSGRALELLVPRNTRLTHFSCGMEIPSGQPCDGTAIVRGPGGYERRIQGTFVRWTSSSMPQIAGGVWSIEPVCSAPPRFSYYTCSTQLVAPN